MWPLIPIRNRLADELNLSGGINALLEWDSTLFDAMQLPDGVDRNLVINRILMEHGERALLHPSPEYMKKAMEVWSAIRMPVWVKLIDTTTYDYNPIHNYDRKEEYTDTRNVTRNRDMSGQYKDSSTTEDIQNTSNDTETVHEVSAENSSGWQPESKDTGEQIMTVSTDTEVSQNGNTSSNEQEHEGETFTHTAHLFGNIGVTTTQQMIREQRDIVNYSIIQQISNDWRDEFCLLVW